MKILLAQIDPKVGDIGGNRALIAETRKNAPGDTDLLVFPELAISGYPPEDLVLKPSFQRACLHALDELAALSADGGPGMVLGLPWPEGGRLYNAAVLVDGGKISAPVFKHKLPNYGVFDEMRIFSPGPLPAPVEFRGRRLGVMICEDMWTKEPTASLAGAGAELLVVLNASPFEMDKPGKRLGLARERVRECSRALVYVNQAGGQDELVFDGASFVLSSSGEVMARMGEFAPGIMDVNLQDAPGSRLEPEKREIVPELETIEAIYRALVTGLGDYVNKNFFPGVMIGLSGGVDSALSAAIAVDALGPERVHCVMMPSPYTSRESLEDAAAAAGMLGVRLDNIPINDAMNAFDGMLSEQFATHPKDTTEENIQARSRGIILMAISNKFGYMVLSTGNKSEMSVGYATLYGDMCGGYSVLKDVYKTTVWELCRWRNVNRPVGDLAGLLGPAGPVMPERIITKAPSAELKPNQTDQDSLPEYAELDDILHGLVELELPLAEIEKRGHARETVAKVWQMLDNAEYKRRQAPPGVKITSRAFGRDRRYPLTNGFRAETPS